MRWDAVGYSGRAVARTPVLDRLAAEGVAFDNAYCASPICSPARASWVTGLYPHGHCQYINYTPKWEGIRGCSMAAGTATIGDVLKGEGYACAIAGVWHLADDYQPNHGFTDYWVKYSYHDLSLPDPHFAELEQLGLFNPYDPANGCIEQIGIFPYTDIADPRQQRTSWVVDRALEYLERPGLGEEEPFFLMVGIKDPHPPMAPPPDLLREYRPEAMPLPENFRDSLEGKPPWQLRGRRRLTEDNLGEHEMRMMMQYYHALVAHVDREVGRLVESLERQGLRDDTIFVFSSDHGEQLGNHGFVEKGYFYEESVRVPCVVSWPSRLPRKMRVSTPLAGVDLMPTLVDLTGGRAPERIDGRSLAADLLAARQPEPAPVFAEIGDGIMIGNSADPAHFATRVMALDGGWKYVRNRDEIDELYDLASDPSEMVNLALEAAQRPRVSAMRSLIADMVGKTGPDHYAWCTT